MLFANCDVAQLIASFLGPFSYLEFRTVCKKSAETIPYSKPDIDIVPHFYSRDETRAAERKKYIPKQSRSHKILRIIIEKFTNNPPAQLINNMSFACHLLIDRLWDSLYLYLRKTNPAAAAELLRAILRYDFHTVSPEQFVIREIERSGGTYDGVIFDTILGESGIPSIFLHIAIHMLPAKWMPGCKIPDVPLDFGSINKFAMIYARTRSEHDPEHLRAFLGDKKYKKFTAHVDSYKAVYAGKPVPHKINFYSLFHLNLVSAPAFTLEYFSSIQASIDIPTDVEFDALELGSKIRDSIYADSRVRSVFIHTFGLFEGPNYHLQNEPEPTMLNYIGLAIELDQLDIIRGIDAMKLSLGEYINFNQSIRKFVNNGSLPRSFLQLMKPREIDALSFRIIHGHQVKRSRYTGYFHANDISNFIIHKYPFAEISAFCESVGCEDLFDYSVCEWYGQMVITGVFIKPEHVQAVVANMCPRILPEINAWLAEPFALIELPLANADECLPT